MPPKQLLDPRLKKAFRGVSGLDDATMERIAQEVKDNHARLNGCSVHQFVIDESGRKHGIPFRYKCEACGGTVDQTAWLWYNRGRSDAAKAIAVRALDAHELPTVKAADRVPLALKKTTTPKVGHSPHLGR